MINIKKAAGSGKTKIKQLLKGNKKPLLVLALIILLGFAGLGAYNYKVQKNDTEASKVVDQINADPSLRYDAAKCSEQIANIDKQVNVDKAPANKKNDLLQFKIDCYLSAGKYDDALVAANKLKESYDKEGTDQQKQQAQAYIDEINMIISTKKVDEENARKVEEMKQQGVQNDGPLL